MLSGLVGLQTPRSAPGVLIKMWRDAAFRLVASEHILREVERGLAKPYFRKRISPGEAALMVETVRSLAVLVEPASGVTVSPDDADNL